MKLSSRLSTRSKKPNMKPQRTSLTSQKCRKTPSAPKQSQVSTKDATSPSATINDIKKSLANLRRILTSDIAASKKKQDECIDVINEHDRNITSHKRDISNLKLLLEDYRAQIGTLRFMIVTTVLIAIFALIFAGIAHARINSLKELPPQSTTYDTTNLFNSTAN